MKIDVQLDDAEFTAALKTLKDRAENLKPLFDDIGEHLAETTKMRFATSTAPDGTRWAPNTPATYLGYLSAFKTSFSKSGRISAKGQARASNKRPLIGETGLLAYTISYDAGSNSVDIFSPLIYSAVQQFGNPNNRYFGGALAPIPARPYLGLSDDDRGAIIEKVAGYLKL